MSTGNETISGIFRVETDDVETLHDQVVALAMVADPPVIAVRPGGGL